MPRILSVRTFNSVLKQHNEDLRKAGFSVSSCGTARLARKWFDKPQQYDVLIIGHTVPHRQRKLLIKRVKEVGAQIRIILFSAGDIGNAGESDAIVRVDTGPQNIAATVHDLIDAVPRTALEPPVSGPEPMHGHVNLLHIAATERIAVLRTNQLRAAGHATAGAVTLQQIELSLTKDHFDLIIIGPAVGPIMKSMIASVVQQHSSNVRILETGITAPVIGGADTTLAESGEDLLNAIQRVLRSN